MGSARFARAESSARFARIFPLSFVHFLFSLVHFHHFIQNFQILKKNLINGTRLCSAKIATRFLLKMAKSLISPFWGFPSAFSPKAKIGKIFRKENLTNSSMNY